MSNAFWDNYSYQFFSSRGKKKYIGIKVSGLVRPAPSENQAEWVSAHAQIRYFHPSCSVPSCMSNRGDQVVISRDIRSSLCFRGARPIVLGNFWATFWFKADAKHDKINDFTKNFNLCKFVEWLAGLPSYIRADNRLKRRAKMAVFVYVLSMNGNGWLEATFLYEQHLKAKFISEERKT